MVQVGLQNPHISACTVEQMVVLLLDREHRKRSRFRYVGKVMISSLGGNLEFEVPRDVHVGSLVHHSMAEFVAQVRTAGKLSTQDRRTPNIPEGS